MNAGYYGLLLLPWHYDSTRCGIYAQDDKEANYLVLSLSSIPGDRAYAIELSNNMVKAHNAWLERDYDGGISESQKNRLIRLGRVLQGAIETQGCNTGVITLNYSFVKAAKNELAKLEGSDGDDNQSFNDCEAVPNISSVDQAVKVLQQAISHHSQYERALTYLQMALLQREEKEEGLLEEIDELKAKSLREKFAGTAEIASDLANKAMISVVDSSEVPNAYHSIDYLAQACPSGETYQQAINSVRNALLKLEEQADRDMEEIDQLKNKIVSLVMSS